MCPRLFATRPPRPTHTERHTCPRLFVTRPPRPTHACHTRHPAYVPRTPHPPQPRLRALHAAPHTHTTRPRRALHIIMPLLLPRRRTGGCRTRRFHHSAVSPVRRFHPLGGFTRRPGFNLRADVILSALHLYPCVSVIKTTHAGHQSPLSQRTSSPTIRELQRKLNWTPSIADTRSLQVTYRSRIVSNTIRQPSARRQTRPKQAPDT